MKRHLVNTSSIGMTSVLFIVLAVFYGASSSAPAEQAGLPDSFQIGPVRMVLIPATKQALPPLVDGFADFDAEPLIVDVPAFYLAERPVLPEDFPDFINRYGPENFFIRPDRPGPVHFVTQLQRTLFIEYLNVEAASEKDGRPMPGAFALPTIAQLFSAAFKGNRYTRDIAIPEWMKGINNAVADRFTGSPLFSGRTPAYGNPPKVEPHRDPLSVKRGFRTSLVSWPDILEKKKFTASRAHSCAMSPCGYSTPINIGSCVSGISICYILDLKKGVGE